MFGSNGPCSPADYMPHYTSILEPIYYPSTRDSTQQIQPLTFDSDPDCHSSAPPTPDIISGLISLTGGPSPSDLSSGSFGDLTSPEPDYHSASSPPSYSIDVSKVQATRTQLIKEGLKLTIQSRRMVQGLDNARPEYRMPPQEQLTPEDEDRRRRRRERNKVAATKCRNKKKERTGKLVAESETLEINNNALKSEIHSLEAERNELINLLQGHLPHCSKNSSRNYYGHPNSIANCHAPSWSSVSG
ncbi:fos-related antigen 2-like [Argiope bruennichi]|uniref:Cyclic AMP-dependent transcription factor like protein n=1 Tax=Argiope bruennichi TaxID=94029 RepID=A0A8T0G421_ARGBR|nr:fos-related antigen 2-like [Argiope bruennichi]XP_055948224.1 fos-related antigen 2-like [Argiope bruennichi]XP_055948225.1 fos-related antigen 2-like [Argiope bruennichi]XP_055948226.1 fos-related antigen 2-like [Argiope bruennichi]XP_055948227.1 fos-related antigen 2-like [Argiope bruennichi]KAF8795993.1 Cyclic AMP-dependent transcription factor like protein [Argiope bruennichi]